MTEEKYKEETLHSSLWCLDLYPKIYLFIFKKKKLKNFEKDGKIGYINNPLMIYACPEFLSSSY